MRGVIGSDAIIVIVKHLSLLNFPHRKQQNMHSAVNISPYAINILLAVAPVVINATQKPCEVAVLLSQNHQAAGRVRAADQVHYAVIVAEQLVPEQVDLAGVFSDYGVLTDVVDGSDDEALDGVVYDFDGGVDAL